jgi:hypothetical protein
LPLFVNLRSGSIDGDSKDLAVILVETGVQVVHQLYSKVWNNWFRVAGWGSLFSPQSHWSRPAG